MKICTKCKIEKPETEFSKCKTNSVGLRSECKTCNSDYYKANKERVIARVSGYRLQNKEKIAAQRKKYRSINSANISERKAKHYAANKTKIAERMAKYYRDNKEQICNYQSEHYAANRDRIAKRAAEYRDANKERFADYRAANLESRAVYERNRRAKKRNAEGRHSAADITRIFEHQRGLCVNCHAKLFKSGKQTFHVDHIVPLAKGGSNWPDNLQCLCPTCNTSKHAKDPIEWAQQNGRLI